MAPVRSTNWIWTPDWSREDEATARLVYFRKRICLEPGSAPVRVKITADTRYKLYVNGVLREVGPSKGDRSVWFVDELDLTDSLRVGENILAVAVLRYPLEVGKGNHSLFRTKTPGLFIEGVGMDGWRCHVDRYTGFYREEERFAPLIIHEYAAADPLAFGWKVAGFNDSAWETARPYADTALPEVLRPEKLKERPIPFMERKLHRFVLPVRTIPAYTEENFVLDAGEEMCAFPRLSFIGGAGAAVELLYAECYVTEKGKKNRVDAERGYLEG